MTGTIGEAVQGAIAESSGQDAQVAQLVDSWAKKIEHGQKFERNTYKQYEDDRRVARGDTDWQVDTNLVGAILEILCAFIYAKDPDVSVTVAPSVGDLRKKQLKDVCETLQVVVSRLIRDGKLKKKAQRWVRSSRTVGAGWLCPALQTRTEKDPTIQAQINDLQQNLANIESLQRDVDSGESVNADVDRQRIQDNIKALEAKLERTIATGLVFDFYRPDNVIVSPECDELVDYENAPWITKQIFRSKEQAKQITGWNAEILKSANVYRRRPQGGEQSNDGFDTSKYVQCDDKSESMEGFVCFMETWSLTDGMVYTSVQGVKDRWAREPFAPTTGSRFYDLFLLGAHYIDGERHPQGDVYQLKKLQDEYGRTRSNMSEHRKRSIPMSIWNGGEIDEHNLGKINDAEAGENVAINTTSGGAIPMQNLVFRTSGVGFDPAMYSTDMIRSDMEKVSGAQDAMQSSVTVAKTATEAGIQNEGFGARIGVQRGELESVLSEMMLYIAQISLQSLPLDFVVKIAGPAAVWPRLSVDEIHYAFDIEVVAGSTGKPDKRKQREAWQVLLPNIEKMIVAIGNFRNQGQEWAAQPYVNMLKYTAELLDFSGDIDDFIPAPPPPDPTQQLLAGVQSAVTGAAPPPPMAATMEPVGTPAGADSPAP
jgi:hypothetical protein